MIQPAPPGRIAKPGCSYEPVNRDDLARLAWISRADLTDFFARKPRYSALDERLICIALCQGAALHFVDGKNGVKDFDVWAFFAAYPNDSPFPCRRLKAMDFGDPKFGRSPDKPDFVGRRVDLLGRSLKVVEGEDPTAVLCRYLSEGRTKTASRLSEKAVVLLEPANQLGDVVWPVEHDG